MVPLVLEMCDNLYSQGVYILCRPCRATIRRLWVAYIRPWAHTLPLSLG